MNANGMMGFPTLTGDVLVHRQLARPVVVQKFGGTSVGSLDRIRHVAKLALAAQASGKQIVVVVSAMSGETNRLLSLAAQLSALPDLAERDVLAATGEQASAALTAIAIRAAGGKARSFVGSQLRILTDSSFGDARVRHIETEKIVAALAAGEIPVIAGFQGVDDSGRITTLGRGGSDTTAVALAASLAAESCEIFTDVDGVYTADPAVCTDARKLSSISYRQMLMLTSLGAKVLHGRSVAIAMQHGVPVHVRSSWSDCEGTWLQTHTETLETAGVTGLACDRQVTRLATNGGALAAERLGENGIPVEVVSSEAITVRAADGERAQAILESEGLTVYARSPVSKVSVVGFGLQTEPAMVAKVTRLLRQRGIEPSSLHAGETAITVMLDGKETEIAMQALHDGFELAKGQLL